MDMTRAPITADAPITISARGRPRACRLRRFTMRLTPEQAQRFEEEGYLFFPSLFTPAEAELLRDRALSDERISSPNAKREEQSSTVRMLRGVHREDPVLARLTRHPRVLVPSQQISGEPVYLYQSRVVVKAGMEERAFTPYPWHQDFSTWWLTDGMLEPRPIVTAIFLDEITACNAP